MQVQQFEKTAEILPPEMNRNTQKDWNAQPASDAVEVVVPTLGTEVFVFAGTAQWR
jgi:hypothetical protein